MSTPETPTSQGRTPRRALTRRSFLVGLTGTGVAFGLVAACAPTPPAAPTSAPAAPAKPAEAAKPAESKPAAPAAQATTAPAVKPVSNAKPPTLVHNSGSDPTTLDPHFGESSVMASVLGQSMEALVGYDKDMNPVPLLAESWQVMDDKVTWRFKLRQNVKFQNGEPFNAEAVKFTIDRTMNEDLRKQGLNDPFPSRSGIQKAEVKDANTIDLVLKQPNVILPIFLGFLYILEPKYYTATAIKDTALKPIGTGPYKVTEWVKSDHVTFEAFEGYWRGVPPIPKFFQKPVPEAATRLNLLLAGDADLVGGLASVDIPSVEADPKLRVSKAPGSRRAHIGIPTNIPRYKDRKVRQALAQAIDYDGIAKAILGSIAPPERRATTLVSSKQWEAPDLKPYTYDPNAAKAALQAAGYPFNEPVKVYSTNESQSTEIVQAVAGSLRAIGINAEAQPLDPNVYTDKMRSDQGIDDLYYSSLGSRYNGPEDVSIVTTGQIWDQTHWSKETENGPKFGDLYKQLSQTFDDKEQHNIVNQMLKLFHEETVWMPLWILPVAAGVNKRITWQDTGAGNRMELWPTGQDPFKVVG
jgi:peptide/nickel transport system substrate-binding protein